MKWKDETVAKELLWKQKIIYDRIDDCERALNELNDTSRKINIELEKVLIIDNCGSYILDTLICDNLNNITKYAYEYGYRNLNNNKLIKYQILDNVNELQIQQLNYLKQIFEMD